MDPVVVTRRKDNLFHMLIDAVGGVQYKLIMFVMLCFFVVSTDMFVHRVLSKIPDATLYEQPTTWGVTVQAMFLAIGFIVFDALIRLGVL